MGAAPIQACYRRALRHPVPQASERAFIVTRARRKSFLWLRRGFSGGGKDSDAEARLESWLPYNRLNTITKLKSERRTIADLAIKPYHSH